MHLNNGTLLSSDKHDNFKEDHVLYFTRDGELVKSKCEGGEVDCVVDSFLELSEVFVSVRGPRHVDEA